MWSKVAGDYLSQVSHAGTLFSRDSAYHGKRITCRNKLEDQQSLLPKLINEHNALR